VIVCDEDHGALVRALSDSPGFRELRCRFSDLQCKVVHRNGSVDDRRNFLVPVIAPQARRAAAAKAAAVLWHG
jgi:hypothetical protein